MKVAAFAVVAVAAISLVAGSTCKANAEGYRNGHKRHTKGYYPQYAGRRYKPAYPDASGWFPHDANQLAFGSALWWDQMRRENRVNK
jgi:hypothetical protein